MINTDVINDLIWLYSLFDIKLLTVIATGFTIYFGYQKVTNKLCVSYSISTDGIYNSHVTNFVISNKRDNTVIISSVNMRIGKKGSVQLINFDEPLVIKPFEAQLIDIPKYSEIYDKNGDYVSIDFLEDLSFSVITRSGNVIICNTESPLSLNDINETLTKSSSIFNGIVLTRKIGFIFSYQINGTTSDVIFDKNGFITNQTPFNYNFFNDMSAVSFGDFLINHGYHEFYDNYALFEVKSNLEVELVLNKLKNQERLKNTTY